MVKVTVGNKKKSNSSYQQLNRKKRVERKVKIPLRKQDIEKMFKSCVSDRERRLLTVFLNTGIHPSVLSDPVKYDMDIVRGHLTWRRPKTYALCVYEYGGDMEVLINEFIKYDLGLSRVTYYRIIKGIAARGGLKNVSPLTLRHTATFLGLERDGPAKTLQKIRCSPKVLWGHYANIRGVIEDREGD